MSTAAIFALSLVVFFLSPEYFKGTHTWRRLGRRVAKEMEIHAVFTFFLIIFWRYESGLKKPRTFFPKNLPCFTDFIYFFPPRKFLWIVGKWEFREISPEQLCPVGCLYCSLPWLWVKALKFALQTKIFLKNVAEGYAYSVSGWKHSSKHSFSLFHDNPALWKCPSCRLRLFYATYCTKKGRKKPQKVNGAL